MNYEFSFFFKYHYVLGTESKGNTPVLLQCGCFKKKCFCMTSDGWYKSLI